MLKKLKRRLRKVYRREETFEEKFLQYVAEMNELNIGLEFDYIKKHNKLDIMNLDSWIDNEFKALTL